MYKSINRMSPSFLSVIVRHALHRKLCRVFRILGTVYDIYGRTSIVGSDFLLERAARRHDRSQGSLDYKVLWISPVWASDWKCSKWGTIDTRQP